MQYRLPLTEVKTPEDVAKLVAAFSEISEQLDVLYTTTAPNGNISARQGRIAVYNNSGVYTTWINTDGATTWQQIDSADMVYDNTRFVIQQFTQAASGTVQRTGVGFAPKGLIVHAFVDSGMEESIAYRGTAGSQGIYYTASNASDDATTVKKCYNMSTSNVIYLDDGTNTIQATLTSLDDDGCTLEFTLVKGAQTATALIFFLR